MHFYYDHLPATLDSEKRAQFFFEIKTGLIWNHQRHPVAISKAFVLLLVVSSVLSIFVLYSLLSFFPDFVWPSFSHFHEFLFLNLP